MIVCERCGRPVPPNYRHDGRCENCWAADVDYALARRGRRARLEREPGDDERELTQTRSGRL
jgi:hypothetical protein